MKRKFSAGLSALMVLLITGSALAASSGSLDSSSSGVSGYEEAHQVYDSGTYNFKAGTYEGKLVNIFKDNVEATINIENNGTLEVTGISNSSAIDISSEGSSNSTVTVNGNLNLSIPKITNEKLHPVDIFNFSSLTINGNLTLKPFSAQRDGGYYTEYVGAYSNTTGELNITKDFTIDGMDINVNTPYNEIGGINARSSNMTLGTDNTNAISIKNINVKSDSSSLNVYAANARFNSTITLNANTTINNIKAEEQYEDAEIKVIGLLADEGNIYANGDLKIANIQCSADTNAPALIKALYADEGGKIYVNQNQNSNRNVQIDGDMATDDNNDSLIQLNLTNANSYIHGAIDGNVDLYMANNAVWRVQQGVSTGDGLEHHLKSLTGNGGIIEMDIDASKNTDNPHLFVQNLEGTHTLKLNNTSNSDISGAEGNVLVTANGSGKLIAPASEGSLYWTKYELATKERETATYTTDWYLKNSGKTPVEPVDPVDPVDPSDPSDPSDPGKPHYTTSVSTLLSTITAGYDTWRSDTDKLNERLGELRLNGKAAEGVWVRTKGSQFGRHGGNGSYTNQQHTYQLGYDAVASKNAEQTTYTGFAAEYGKGNLSFDRGTGTMKSAGLGLYQTQLRESGHYLDFVYKFDKYKNDFHVADTAGNPISGKYSNNAMSLSAEYGRQNALKDGWYIEPQAALTLGYMWGNDFTTSNNIRVEQKNMPALIGRLGLNIGRNIGDKVNFYVKANINHDFLGKYDMQMTDLTYGDRLNASDKFASSWFDYGAGFTVRTSNNSYAYFDIERAVGGEYKKNWDWNVGLRWSF